MLGKIACHQLHCASLRYAGAAILPNVCAYQHLPVDIVLTRFRSLRATSPNSCLCEIVSSNLRSAPAWSANFASSAHIRRHFLSNYFLFIRKRRQLYSQRLVWSDLLFSSHCEWKNDEKETRPLEHERWRFSFLYWMTSKEKPNRHASCRKCVNKR